MRDRLSRLWNIARIGGLVRAGAYGLVNRANAARDRKSYGDAAALYEQALALIPDDAAIHVQCGHMFKEAGGLAKAEEHYQRAQALTPDDPDLALQMGHFYKIAGRLPESRAAYARASELRPEWPEPMAELEALNCEPPQLLSEITNPARYNDPEWIAIHMDLERYSIDKHCFQHISGEVVRKGWEWTHCLFGLEKLGALVPSARALGVGVGREPVIFYLAARLAEVVATDLYGNQAWSSVRGAEASVDLLEKAKAACPIAVDLSRVRFENQDGTQLLYADDYFDFAWSLSSIEHFGGHSGAQQALNEMGRVVRPGGIVAVATEMLLLDDQTHPEFFTRRELIDDLILPCSNLSLVDAIDFDALPVEYLVDSIVVPAGVDRMRRHVVLNNGQVQWTSVMFFLRKNATLA